MRARALVAAVAVLTVAAPSAQAATVGVTDGVCTITATQADVDAYASWGEPSPVVAGSVEAIDRADAAAGVPDTAVTPFEEAVQAQRAELYRACAEGRSANVTLARADGRGVLPPGLSAPSADQLPIIGALVALGAAVAAFWPQIWALLNP